MAATEPRWRGPALQSDIVIDEPQRSAGQAGGAQQKTEPLPVPGRRARKDMVVTKLLNKAMGNRSDRRAVDAESVARTCVQSSRRGIPVGPASGGTNEMGFLGSVLEYPGHFDRETVSAERRGLKMQECAQDQSSLK